ncbi:MAG: sugar phosphate isomerase/epimerase family protein [Planctomycetota bacterium]|nr:sugar phosphate isomerase/epimerase family protein [Planctomycetota bacterium]
MNRRTFLTTSSAIAAGSAATLVAGDAQQQSSWVAAASGAEKRFKKAVKIGMVRIQGGLKEKFAVLKELGFDGVELNSPNNYRLEEVKSAIDATGLPVHGVVDSQHWNKTLSHESESVRKEGLAALTTAIRDAKSYGASSVLLVPAVVNKEATYEKSWKRSIPMIKQAIPLAEEMGIDILLENVWNNFLNDPAETAKYIDELESDRVGAYYDTGNSVRYANPVVWIRTLGKRIKKHDIKEFDLARVKNEKWFDGFGAKLLEGSNGWYDIIRELKKLDFKGWGTAEIPGGDRKRLSEIAERMDRIFAM